MKKALSVALLGALALTAVGGTLAYFTDTDEKTNTFTSGKVDISLEEKFEQNSKLLPGKENAVQKEVSIKLNDGSEDSYVWYEWLIPATLDSTDGSTGTNNFVHVNSFGRTWDTYREETKYWIEGQTEALPETQTWDHDPNEELSTLVGPEGFIGTETIDDVEYNKYVVLYHGVLSAGEETTPAMSQVYLDQGVNTNADGDYVKGETTIEKEFLQDFDIIVRAYGIQAAGIENVYAAYKAYNAQE